MKTFKIEPIKNPQKIINYWKRESLVVILIMISGIAYNVGMIAGPIYQGKLIDGLLHGTFSQISYLAAAFIVLIIIVQFFRYIKRFYIRRFANNTSATMRLMLYHTILWKKQVQLEQENMGSLMVKAVSDVDACVEGMRKFTTEVFDTGVLLLSYIITMLIYDVKTTILSCVFIPAAMFIAEKLKKIIYQNTNSYRKIMSDVSNVTYDQINNATLYRLLSREEDNEENYIKLLNDYEKKAIIANIWENSMQPIYNVIAMAGVIFVITIGGNLVAKGVWSIGEFSTYITIFTAMAFKASKAAKLFNSVQKAKVSWKRIQPYLKEYEDMERVSLQQQNITSTDLKIVDLTFTYPNGKRILDGINLEARAGEMVGITGPIACGKSTLGKLFLGEYSYRGIIKIDGKNLYEYTDQERSKIISYLGHNTQLLSDTIYNNITLGEKGDISDILKIVCLEQDLSQMENGINTLVGNGGIRLSGGQQSRIALARTLYHKKKILILDDPFAAVDVKTEREIFSNLKRYLRDCIVLIISHRLGIFEQTDHMMVMNSDRTYEYGTHKKLLNSSHLYQELFKLQSSEESDNYE